MVFGHARQGVDWLKEELQRIAALKSMREGIRPLPAVQVQPASEETGSAGLDVASGIAGTLAAAGTSFIPGAGPILAPLAGTAVQQGVKALGGEGNATEAIKGFGGAVGAGAQRASGAWAKSQQEKLQDQERLAERQALFNRMEQYRSPQGGVLQSGSPDISYKSPAGGFTAPPMLQPRHPVTETITEPLTRPAAPPILQPRHPVTETITEPLTDEVTDPHQYKGPTGEGQFPYEKIPTKTEDRVNKEKESGFYDDRGVLLPGSPILHRRTSGRTAEAMSAKPGLVSRVREAADSFSPQYGLAQGPGPQGMPNQTIAQMESALASGDVPLHQVEEMTRLLSQLRARYGGTA